MAVETNPSTPESSPPPRYSVEDFKALAPDSLTDRATARETANRLPTFTPDELNDPQIRDRINRVCLFATVIPKEGEPKEPADLTVAELLDFRDEKLVAAGILTRQGDRTLPLKTDSHISEDIYTVLGDRLGKQAGKEIVAQFKAMKADPARDSKTFRPGQELAELTAQTALKGVSIDSSQLEKIATDTRIPAAERKAYIEQTATRIGKIPQERAALERAQVEASNQRTAAWESERQRLAEEARENESKARQAEEKAVEAAYHDDERLDAWQQDIAAAGSKEAAISSAHEEALRQDWATREGNRITEEFRTRIQEAVVPAMAEQLEAEREKAIADLQTRMAVTNKQAAETLGAVQTALREKAEFTTTFRRGEVKDLEEQASAIHDVLHLEKLPFEVKKEGGWRFRQDRRGPQVIEAYYRSTTDPNVVVVERYLRRSEKLLSQTVCTTERPIKDKGSGEYALPRGFMKRLTAIRQQDRSPAVHKAKVGDYLSYGSVNLGAVGERYYGATTADLAQVPGKRRRPGNWFFNLLGLNSW